MLARKYGLLRKIAKKYIGPLKDKVISEGAFDAFTKNVLSETALDLPGFLYCRDGFTFIHRVEKYVFQVVALQINSFGAGIFRKEMLKCCTPILITFKIHGSHPYLNHNIKEAVISVEDFYLGRNFSGSKGPLCDRDMFNSAVRKLFVSPKGSMGSISYKTALNLINTNYICHHIAEALGYAGGALDIYWTYKNSMLFLTAGSRFSEKRDKLYIDIIDDFSNEKMRSYFQIPHYALLAGKVQRFKEARDITLLEVTYNKETQSFYIPAGYQKIDKKLFHQNVQIVTTQHIVEHVLADYYKRKNSFIVANTFQILEYLSRAMFAKLKGFHEEAGRFIKAASCCKGQYPDSNLDEVLQKKSESYPIFASEFAYNMFFRSPLLK